MFDFGIPIFPFDSAAVTVTTTVWLGVCVAVFFNLRFGWTLSALVVPGYLVPLLMTRPITAGVIVFEAAITYWLARFLSDLPRQNAYWSSFFGRDRFFVILIISVLVRAVCDGWLLPYVGSILVEEYHLNFDYRNELHSFGLIVVALIANYFWKPGIVRGFMPLMTCILATWFLVQMVLIPFTNFNVGNFHLIYEDISTSLLASPKAYIILLMTAYLASWFNLKFAWDFNGILIPALLGLMWYDPAKILVSAAECLVILFLASMILKTPWFRKLTVEGGRKLCFFFTICFVYRIVLAHTMPVVFPSMELSDTFGFGYLLTTLMAIKTHGKRFTVRMLRSNAEVSVLGAVAGSLIGFAFYCGPEIQFDYSTTNAATDQVEHEYSVAYSNKSLQELVNENKILLYEKKAPGSYQPPMPFETNSFGDIVAELRTLQGCDVNEVRETINAIGNRLRGINYELVVVGKRYFLLHEKSPAKGWGMYVIDTAQPSGICVEVPAPLDEWGTTNSGICLFQQLPCSALAIAGTPRKVDASGAADVTLARGTMFEEFHQLFTRSEGSSCFQVRGQLAKNRIAKHESNSRSQLQSRLWIRDAIAPQLKLSQLKELCGSFDISWNDSPLDNRLRQRTSGNFAELFLNIDARRKLIGKLFIDENGLNESDAKYAIKITRGKFRKWMDGIKSKIVPQGSDGYQPASLEQMLFMDHEVVSPLVALMSSLPDQAVVETEVPFWKDRTVLERMAPIQAAASSLGYRIDIVVDPLSSETYVVLNETFGEPTNGQLDETKQKGWGTFVFRPGLADSFAVEIPRPLFETRSFDFGVNLFERPRASALLVAGAHPRGNFNGSADISKAANKTNLFNLVRHILLRQMESRPYLITQARAIQAPVEADIVLATDDGTKQVSRLTPLKRQLVNQLTEDRLSYTFVDGREKTAGYELGILMQATSVQVSQRKEVVSLWLSPSLRTKFREQSENNTLSAQFKACGIPSINDDLARYLVEFAKHTSLDGTGREMRATPLPAVLRSELKQYVDTSDVLKLIQIVKRFNDWKFVRLTDGGSGQAYLLVSKSNQEFPTVVNLTGYIGDHAVELENVDAETIDGYIRSRALWLIPARPSSKAQVAVSAEVSR